MAISIDVHHLRTAWRCVLKLNRHTQHTPLSVPIEFEHVSPELKPFSNHKWVDVDRYSFLNVPMYGCGMTHATRRHSAGHATERRTQGHGHAQDVLQQGAAGDERTAYCTLLRGRAAPLTALHIPSLRKPTPWWALQRERLTASGHSAITHTVASGQRSRALLSVAGASILPFTCRRTSASSRASVWQFNQRYSLRLIKLVSHTRNTTHTIPLQKNQKRPNTGIIPVNLPH